MRTVLNILPNSHGDDYFPEKLQINIYSRIYHIELSFRQGYDKFTKRKQTAHDMPDTKKYGKCPMNSHPSDQKNQFHLEL